MKLKRRISVERLPYAWMHFWTVYYPHCFWWKKLGYKPDENKLPCKMFSVSCFHLGQEYSTSSHFWPCSSWSQACLKFRKLQWWKMNGGVKGSWFFSTLIKARLGFCWGMGTGRMFFILMELVHLSIRWLHWGASPFLWSWVKELVLLFKSRPFWKN